MIAHGAWVQRNETTILVFFMLAMFGYFEERPP